MKLLQTKDILKVSDDLPIIILTFLLSMFVFGIGLSNLRWPFVVWSYVIGMVITYVLSAIFVVCNSDKERRWLMGYVVSWPGLYISLLFFNTGLMLYQFHNWMFAAHKTLAGQLFVRKPKLLKDKPMSFDSNEYRNQQMCQECNRPK